MYGVWWITAAVMIRPSQPSLAGVWAGAELGNSSALLVKSDFKIRNVLWKDSYVYSKGFFKGP